MFTLVILIAVGLVFLAIHAYSSQEIDESKAAFNKQFPPLTDEEFLAQCEHGTNPVVALKVRRILADSLGVDYERIYPSMSLVNDLDCC